MPPYTLKPVALPYPYRVYVVNPVVWGVILLAATWRTLVGVQAFSALNFPCGRCPRDRGIDRPRGSVPCSVVSCASAVVKGR